jgi:hypothetical protein
MSSLKALTKMGYLLALAVALSLLLWPNPSPGQFRAIPPANFPTTPPVPGMPTHMVIMPAPALMLPLNNMLTDSTGGAMSMGIGGGMGGVGTMIGGGMGGMGMGGMGMGGGMMGFAGKGMGGFNGKKAL